MSEVRKHEYLEKDNLYETNFVSKGRKSKTCAHCGKDIAKGTKHDVNKFYPEFESYPTHIKCTEDFKKSLN